MDDLIGALEFIWLPLFTPGLACWLMPGEAFEPYRLLGKIATFVGAIFFASSVMLSMVWNQDGLEASTPRRKTIPVRDSAPHLYAAVSDESVYSPVLNRELDFGPARGPDVVTATGSYLARLGRAMLDGASDVDRSVTRINLIVQAGLSDRPDRRLLHLSIETNTLRRLARQGVLASQFLDAAHDAGSWTPTNDDVVNAYCVTPSPFCEQVRAR